MSAVVAPLVLLFAIVLIKPIPWIGGSVKAALLVSGLATALLSGLGPGQYVSGVVDGLDRMAWVIALSVFGAIYAETQVRTGTIDTTMNMLRRLFGDSPRGLIAATFVTLVIGGSLLGDAIATSTVVGFLVIHALAEMKIKPVQIGMIILVGASLGSIMPPITQAILMASSLVGIDSGPVVRIAFVTVGIGVLLAILESFRFAPRGGSASQTLGAAPPIGTTLRTRGYTLVPMLVLLGIVLLNVGWDYDIFTELPGLSHLSVALGQIPVIRGLVHPIVLAIVVSILVAALFPAVHRKPGETTIEGLRKVSQTVQIQLCAAFLIGMFYASGAVDTVAAVASGHQGVSVTLFGTVAMIAVGMLTGSQTAAQTIVVPFFAPVLLQNGVDPVNVALGVSHIASGGQNMPPVGLTAFVVCGLVGGVVNAKVDPVKVMFYALPNSIYLVGVGLIALLM